MSSMSDTRSSTARHRPGPVPGPPGHDGPPPDWSTNTTDGFDGNKAEAQAALIGMNERLADLQQLLYAEAEHKLLIVLQGMDTSGKDGTIKHVFRTINPLGVKVANFKRPNDVELAHDYLWRIHEHTPRNGRMVIFNRSHYEDVLVVRVHDLVPEKVWSRRYEHIRGLRADAGRRGHRGGQVVPPHLQGGAEGAAPGAARQPGQALEVRARRPQRARPLGRLHRGLRGGHRRDHAPTTRRGTSCPPTASGTATWWSRSC